MFELRRLAVVLALFCWGAGGALAAEEIFTEVAAEAGLEFTHVNGMTGKLYFPEMMSSGAALFDYDGDGDLDAYLAQGGPLGPGAKPDPALGDRLFRNDLEITAGGERRLKFTDVTAESGIRAFGYGMAVASGDYDNDGHADLYVANLGSNQLLRNRGDGTFEDATARAGVDDPRWSTAAVFFDYDGDGHLDLYVVNYVDYAVERDITCYSPSSRRDYCGPSAYKGVADSLFHNRGDGTFEDVALPTGIARAPQPGLGVTAADFNGDGRPDLYVANDGEPNQLWIRRAAGPQAGTFQDEALLAGVAVNRMGQPEASMGVSAADFDGDGDEDLFMTHLLGESNTLFVNAGDAIFEDRTLAFDLAAPSLAYTSFGTAFFDYDNDGWLDLFIANGAVKILEALAQQGDPFPLGQPNQLFRNLGGKRFAEVTERAGAAFAAAEVSRAAAFGDVDEDGDLDILLANTNGPVRLLRNEVGQSRPWLGLRLVDRHGRDALGARVEVEREGAPALWRRAATDGSYAAANDPRVLVGLEGGDKLKAVRVHWPSGESETFPPSPAGRYTTLRQGTGAAPKAAAAEKPATP